jgi:putative IMPACT (imprinted ancient) family translation regulator
VVRYYGGVKLGVGGLIQAYRQAAKEAINSSEIVETEDHFLYEISCDFSQLPQVMNWLKSQKIDIKSQNYTEKHEIIVQIPNSKLSLLNHLTTLNVTYKSLAQ